MKAGATLTLFFLCTVTFALQYYFALQEVDIAKYYALYPPAVPEEPYRLITAMFLHADSAHLAQNMFALLLFGMVLESLIGTRKFLIVYFLAGLVGNLAGMIAYPDAYSLGASGAIMGIVGCLVILRPFMLVWFGGPIPLVLLVSFWIFIDVAGIFDPYSRIGNAAHLAGLFVGALLGSVWKERYDEKKLARKKARKEVELSEEELERWEEEWMMKFKFWLISTLP